MPAEKKAPLRLFSPPWALTMYERLRQPHPLPTSQTTTVPITPKLENHFTCALCYGLFTETMTTSCLHRFCKKCITKWWSKKGVTKRCPFCNKKCASKRDLRPDLTTDAFIKLLFPDGKCTNDHLEMNLVSQDDQMTNQMSDITTEITEKTLTRDLPTIKEEPSINTTLNTLWACQEGENTRKIMPRKASNSKSQKLNDIRKIQGTATRKPTETPASTPQQPSKRLTNRKVQSHVSDHRLNERGCQSDVANTENPEITISDSEEEELSILRSPPQIFFKGDEPTNVPLSQNARVIDSAKLVSNPGSSKIVSSPTNNATQPTVKRHFPFLSFSPNDVNEMARQTNTTNSPSDCCVRIGFDKEPLDSGSEEEAPFRSDLLTYDDQEYEEEVENEFSAEDNIKKPGGPLKRPFRLLDSDEESKEDDQPKAPMFGTFPSRLKAITKISSTPKAQSSRISTDGLLSRKKSAEKEIAGQFISPTPPSQSRLTPSSSSKKRRRSTSPIDEFDDLQEFLDDNDFDTSLGDLFERGPLSKSQGRSFGNRSTRKAKLTATSGTRRRTMKHPVSAPVTAGKIKWTKLLQVEEAKKREKEEMKRAKEEQRPCHLEDARFANINIEDNAALKAIEVSGLHVKDPNRNLRNTWLNKFRNTLFKRIDEVPREEQEDFREQLDTLCLAIENAVWENNKKYKSQNVRLLYNLADPRNSTFFRDVLYGNIAPERLANMDGSEMASEELKQERQLENHKVLEAYKKGSDERNLSDTRQRLKKNHKGVNIIEQMEGPLELDVPEDYGNVTVPKGVPTSTMDSDVVLTSNCPLLSTLQANPNTTFSRITQSPSTSCQSHKPYSDKPPSPPNTLAVPASPSLDECDHEDGGIFDNSNYTSVQSDTTRPIDQLQNTFSSNSSKKRVCFASPLVSGKSAKRPTVPANRMNLVSALKRPRLVSEGCLAQQLPKAISQIEQNQPRNTLLETFTARDNDSLRVTQDSNLTARVTEQEQAHQSGISNLLNSVVSKFMNPGIQHTSSSAAQPSTFARAESHQNVSQIAVWSGDIINEMDKKTCQVNAVPLTPNSKFPRWFTDSNIQTLGFCICNNIEEQHLLSHIEQGSDVAIVRFEPKILAQHPYKELFQFFTVRSSTVLQVGFVRLSGNDFAHNAFIYPLAKETPVPRYLANYLGSSFPLPYQRPDMLLGILTRQQSHANEPKCSVPSASNNQNQFAESVRVSANLGSVSNATLPTNPLEMDSSAMAMIQRQFLLSQQTNHSQTGSLGAPSMSLNTQPLPSGMNHLPTAATLPTQPSHVSAGGPDTIWPQNQFTREPQAVYGTSYQALPDAPYGLGLALNPSHSQQQPTFYQKPTYSYLPNNPMQYAEPNIVSMHGSSSVPPATMHPLVSEPGFFRFPSGNNGPYETNNLHRHEAQFGHLQPYTAVPFPVNQQPPPGHMYQQLPPHDFRMS